MQRETAQASVETLTVSRGGLPVSPNASEDEREGAGGARGNLPGD